MTLTRCLTLAAAICTLASVTIVVPEATAKPIFASKISIDTKSKTGKKLLAAIETLIESRETIMPLGITVANIHDFAPELRQTAKSQLNMGERLQIIHIEHGSLAEKLGLEFGDQLVQLNDLYVARGQRALEKLNSGTLPRLVWSQELNATIIRDGYGQSYSIDPQESIVDARNLSPSDS